jgi:hypothetical protein
VSGSTSRQLQNGLIPAGARPAGRRSSGPIAVAARRRDRAPYPGTLAGRTTSERHRFAPSDPGKGWKRPLRWAHDGPLDARRP